jgi:hypothetical protein
VTNKWKDLYISIYYLGVAHNITSLFPQETRFGFLRGFKQEKDDHLSPLFPRNPCKRVHGGLCFYLRKKMETINLDDLEQYFSLRRVLKEGGSVVLEQPIRLRTGAVFYNAGKEVDFQILQRLRTMTSRLQKPYIFFNI